jgi:hypothetical protein
LVGLASLSVGNRKTQGDDAMTAPSRSQPGTERTTIEARLAELYAEQERATGWGAAVGVRHEEIKALEGRLRAMSAPDRGQDEASARASHPLSGLAGRADACALYNFDSVEMVECKHELWAKIIAALSRDSVQAAPERVTSARVKPTDATVAVLVEALYYCGCPAGGRSVGECAEAEICGCSIHAERLKGCMSEAHQCSTGIDTP